MKLSEVKLLKEEDELFRRVLSELKVKGLDKVYVKKSETVDYLDIALSIINFLSENKDIFKDLTQENYEKLVIICLDEALEEVGITTEIEEEHIEKVLQLLKNSLLVQEFSGKLWDLLVLFYNYHLKYYVDLIFIKLKSDERVHRD